MKVEYIYHSGFSVETDNYFLVFDYYKGDLVPKDKKTIVFVTHGHSDHFNPKIFKWLDKNPDILYVLSSDIGFEPTKEIYIMEPYESLRLQNVDIESFGSTDLGLSLLIKVDSKTIFYAGDLNWWYWDEDSDEEKLSMERAFKGEIAKIEEKNIDLAFFPVDPRLEDNYYLGGEYFINQLKPKVFIPMHFGDNYQITTDFIHKMSDTTTRIVEISKKNELLNI